jgi:hypothetical protein
MIEEIVDMGYKVLTNEQVEYFKEFGWVKVEEAYPRQTALDAQQIVWDNVEKRGILKNDKSTWTEEMVKLNEVYFEKEFQLCNTSHMADAIEDLVGEGRLANRIVYGESSPENQSGYGWWPVNFYMGKDKPWDVPTEGWHWDGIQFKHYIDSPDQGLLCLCLFSEINIQGGGTLIAEGSHKLVAKFLAEQTEGIELKDALPLMKQSHPWLSELTGSDNVSDGNRIDKFMNWHTDADGVRLKVTETTGSPGDIFLCHPFLFHAASQNHLGVPRFMCNRTTPLKDRLQLKREDGSPYSPLETSIRNVLSYE